MALDIKIAGLREGNAGSPCKRHIALARTQCLRGRGNRHQTGGAGGLHADARPGQIEQIGGAGWQIVLVVANLRQVKGDGISRIQHRRSTQMVQQVARQIAAGEDAGPGTVLVGVPRRIAGLLKRLPAAFDKQPVLWVHQRRFGIAQAPEARIEILDAIDNGADLDVARVFEQRSRHAACGELIIGKTANAADTLHQVGPELIEVFCAGKAPGHGDDGNIGSSLPAFGLAWIAPVSPRDRSRCLLLCQFVFNVLAKGRNRGVVEHLHHVDANAELLFCRHYQLDGEQ